MMRKLDCGLPRNSGEVQNILAQQFQNCGFYSKRSPEAAELNLKDGRATLSLNLKKLCFSSFRGQERMLRFKFAVKYLKNLYLLFESGTEKSQSLPIHLAVWECEKENGRKLCLVLPHELSECRNPARYFFSPACLYACIKTMRQDDYSQAEFYGRLRELSCMEILPQLYFNGRGRACPAPLYIASIPQGEESALMALRSLAVQYLKSHQLSASQKFLLLIAWGPEDYAAGFLRDELIVKAFKAALPLYLERAEKLSELCGESENPLLRQNLYSVLCTACNLCNLAEIIGLEYSGPGFVLRTQSIDTGGKQ